MVAPQVSRSLCRSLVLALVLASTAAAQTTFDVPASVQVYSGPGANGPAGLVSNSIPFRPGVLSDPRLVRVLDENGEVPTATRVLARWPGDNSIRALLLQFSAPVARRYTISVGRPRTTSDPAAVPVAWDLPTRVFTLPAQYLSDSYIVGEQRPLGQTGFAAWDQKQVRYYSSIETIGTASCASSDQYYDSITTTYQLYARTGDLKYLANARRWALHHRRDQIQLSGPNAGRSRCADSGKTRYTFPQGLVQDYFMFGDDEARRVAGLIVDNFYMPHAEEHYYIAPRTRGFWTEREPAFALIGILAYYEATGSALYLDRVRQRVASLARMQIDNERRAWVHNLYDHDPSEGCAPSEYGSSPWMSGLLLEAIVGYHWLTDDPVARDSILMAVNDLRARNVATRAYAGASFVYLGCAAYADGSPDLDNLVAHAYGYAYRLTGDESYRTFGTTLFNTAVEHGYTSTHKHFDQQFRSSGHFPAYIAGPGPALSGAPRPPAAPTGLRIVP